MPLAQKRFRAIKSEIRVLGVDDGKFTPHKKGSALIVGVVFKGGKWFEGIMHTTVEIDGFDATDKIAAMIKNSVHFRQIRVVMLNGITFAGFNVVNIKALNSATGLPVIVVVRELPDLEAVNLALKNMPGFEMRWDAVIAAGGIFEVSLKRGQKVYLELVGISCADAQRIVELTATRSSLPEPLRVAHLIASGLS
jgi:endonuclease V-like protein UPF0215 family